MLNRNNEKDERMKSLNIIKLDNNMIKTEYLIRRGGVYIYSLT